MGLNQLGVPLVRVRSSGDSLGGVKTVRGLSG